MRIPSSVKLIALALIVLVGTVALFSAPQSPFTRHDKAFYLDAATANFVRPGLTFTVRSATIASDGTLKKRLSTRA